MATFIMLSSLTPDGVKTMKEHPGRVAEVNREVEALGAKVLVIPASRSSKDPAKAGT